MADSRRLRFLTHEQADALLSQLADRSPDVHDMALVSLHCGLWAGEVFGLTWGAVDLDRERLTLKDTKSGKSRIVPMTDAVRTMLAGRKPSLPSNLVFPGRGGKRIVQISETFYRVVAELGLNDGISDRLTPYDLGLMRAIGHLQKSTEFEVDETAPHFAWPLLSCRARLWPSACPVRA